MFMLQSRYWIFFYFLSHSARHFSPVGCSCAVITEISGNEKAVKSNLLIFLHILSTMPLKTPEDPLTPLWVNDYNTLGSLVAVY